MCKVDGKYKVSFWEMVTSGGTGMLSATGFLGVVTGLVMLVIFLALIVYYFVSPAEAGSILNIIEQCTIWFGMASALLGSRKIAGVLGSRKGSDTVTGVVNALNEDKEVTPLNENKE